MTKFIARVNGFTITQRLVGEPETYFVAKRDAVIHTGKRLSYVEKKAKSHSCLKTPEWFKPVTPEITAN